MSEKIFREKSLKRISSPEELNSYLRVANPGVWVLLIAVIILLSGIFAWGILGQIETKIDSLCEVKNSEAIVYVKEEDVDYLKNTMMVEFDGEKYTISNISNEAIIVDDSFSDYMLHLGNLYKGEWVYKASFKVNEKDGYYEVKTIKEAIKPISLLFN